MLKDFYLTILMLIFEFFVMYNNTDDHVKHKGLPE